MDDPRIVHEKQRPWLLHCEADARWSVGIEHARLAAANVATPYQQQSDEIDAVAVSTLGSRPTDSTGSVDAELMRLDEPSVNGTDLRKQGPNGRHQLRLHRRLHNLRLDWLEPAFEAAMQSVVRRWLPMCAMRRQRQRACHLLDEASMST